MGPAREDDRIGYSKNVEDVTRKQMWMLEGSS